MKGSINITVKQLLEENQDRWNLKLFPGNKNLESKINVVEINRPGLALAGYFDYFKNERIQVLGRTEISYLSTITKLERKEIFNKFFKYYIPSIIITTKLKPPVELTCEAELKRVPILQTNLMTTRFISELSSYLEFNLAERTTMHGDLVDVFGVGILILGKSGIGKSECALDLIKKGHRLVADDFVEIRKTGEKILTGISNKTLAYNIEIRGLGIIDIKRLFGISAIREKKRIDFVVFFEGWRESKEYDRTGLDESEYKILDVELPKIVIPVRPGRDLSMILEVAAVNFRAKRIGYHSARDFDRKIINGLNSKTK